MLIDCYGFEATSQFYQRRTLPPYLMRQVDGVIYMKYYAADVGPVHRIDRDPDGRIRQTWALGKFSEAESLAYVPLTESLADTRTNG